MTAILIWLLGWELFALLGMPWSWLFFRRHSDLGFGTARPLAALAYAYAVFVLGTSGLSDRQRPALVAALAVLAAASIALAWRRRAELVRDLRLHRRALLRSELLYYASWLLLLLPLLFTNTSRYGERAFDLAFLEHLALPGPLPPTNPYLGGEPLNYYYFGHLLYASVSRALGLPTTATYFLATATAGAMTIAAAASLLSRLTASRAGRWGALAITCATMNLAWVRDWLEARSGDALAGSNWMVGNAIDEYPLYALLMSELHAHVMVMPAFVLAIALCLALRDDAEEIESRRWLPPCAALALVAGSIAPTSTWSMLTLGFAMLAILATPEPGGRAPGTRDRLTLSVRVRLLARGAFAFAGGVLLYLPYYLHMRSGYPGLRLVGALTSEPFGFVLHWGLFLWILAGAVVVGLLSQGNLSPASPAKPTRVGVTAVGLLIVAAAAWLAAHLAGGASALPLIVAAFAIAVAIAKLAVSCSDEARTAWVLTAIGWTIIAGCELLHLDDYQSGPLERATTVFKFYMDAWLLLGLGAAALLAELANAAGRSGNDLVADPTANRSVPAPRAARLAARGWAVPLVVAAVVGAAVTVRGVYAKTDGWRTGPQLSPVRFMDDVDPGYADAMRWLAGLPIAIGRRPMVAEAVDPDRNTGWLAVAAPVDAYVAWPNLLVQWRYTPAEIRPRLDNLHRLYTLTDSAAACGLLSAEGIDYVFVGDKERRQFGPNAGAGFAPPHFRRVFSSRGSALFDCKMQEAPTTS